MVAANPNHHDHVGYSLRRVWFDDQDSLFVGTSAQTYIFEGAAPPKLLGGSPGLDVSSDFDDGHGRSVFLAGAWYHVHRIRECAPQCYANCDGSSSTPVLNIDDFICFINRFTEGIPLPPHQQVSHYANCDGSSSTPVLNIDDFVCFIARFSAGCP